MAYYDHTGSPETPGDRKTRRQDRRFREKYLSGGPGAALLEQLSRRRARGFDGYWERFGYEIAGPACYAYVKWIIDTLNEHYGDVTDVAFVARDGYLLKQIYQLLPHPPKTAHYIYAPRAVYRQCRETAEYGQYREYLDRQGFGAGAVAVVDTATMHFSAQRLMGTAAERPVYGLYWVVLREALLDRERVPFRAFQKEKYHVISSWNLMEFIMTSPEPPVRAVENGKPVYCEKNDFEERRAAIFREMSRGVLEFVRDLRDSAPELLCYSPEFTVGWINRFLASPTEEDMEAFNQVRFSMLPDHSDSVPLDPFRKNGSPMCSLKDRIWRFSQRHAGVFYLLHGVKGVYRKLFRSR